MATAHEELRTRLGTVGAWTFAFDAQPVADVRAGGLGPRGARVHRPVGAGGVRLP